MILVHRQVLVILSWAPFCAVGTSLSRPETASMPIRWLAPALAALSLAAGIWAQEDPPAPAPEAAVEEARTLGRLVKRRQTLRRKADVSKSSAEALEKCEGEIATFTKRYVGGAPDLTARHYIEVTSVLIDHAEPELMIELTRAGIQRFPSSRPLRDHLGMAYLITANQAEKVWDLRAALQSAVLAFAEARKLEPATMHTELGAWQAHLHRGEHAQALLALDLLREDPAALPLLGEVELHRGRHLLGSDRAAEAIVELEAALATELEDPAGARLLLARAQWLAGKKDDAVKTSSALLVETEEPALLGGIADLWAAMGKTKEAASLLAKQKLGAAAEDESDSASGDTYKETRSRAALELLLSSKLGNHAKLRAEYAQALGHRFLIGLADGSGKVKEHDLSASPLCMGHLLRQLRSSPSTWAEHGLLALCIAALPQHQLSEQEELVAGALEESSAALRDPALLAEVLALLESGVADPECPGAFALRRLAEVIEKG
jgi:tetratricopeptide (TPR) repeat protein